MKRSVVPAVLFFALSVVSARAYEPSAPPPTLTDGENVFIGHYGEIVRLAYFWTADASMKGEMEVVNFHLAKQDPFAVVSPAFQPAQKDYAPENFARLRLMQMLVIPKDVPGGFKSLRTLREAKTSELAAAGGSYKLQSLGEVWPPDSFQLWVSAPHQFFQVYTQDEKNIFIVTSGASPYDSPPADPVLTNATVRLLNSLSDHLDEARLRMTSRAGFLTDLRVVLLPGAFVGVLGLLLLLLPKRLERPRLAGGMMLGIAAAGHLIAGPLLFASWRMGLDRTINEASILLCAGLAMPWICRFVSLRRNGRKPWRVFTWTVIANILPVLTGYAAMRGFLSGTDAITGSRSFWMMSLSLSLLGALDGIVFGLTHRADERNDKTPRSLAAALVLLLAVPARSQKTQIVQIEGIDIQMGDLPDSESAVQWKVLAARNKISSREQLKRKAHDNLEEQDRLPIKFHRVEMAGMFSSDDTNDTFPGMIDKQLKMSHLNDAVAAKRPWLERLSNLWNKARDIPEALSDSSGTPTERSQKLIRELEGARINELFAHSWGSEAAYLGILNGKILPPKKLFIMGVPDNDEAKWLLLAKYTGIEVHVIGFAWDKARMVGDKVIRVNQFRSGLPSGALLEKLWQKQCSIRANLGCADPARFSRAKFDYDVNVQPPDILEEDFLTIHVPPRSDHSRMLYYRYFYNRNLFNKTIEQMDAPQAKLIAAEEGRILAEALAESRRLIAQARAQVGIDHREHDERLKRTYVDMAIRSCANPGSVTQAELDSLADPYQENLQTSSGLPRGLDDCAIWVYLRLGRGVDAEGIRRHSTPTAPINVNPDPPLPQPAQPIRAPVVAVPMIPFNSTFPRLKDIAETACASPARAALGTHELQPAFPYSFNENLEDAVAARLSANLGDCPRQLFYKLIEMIRSGKGPAVNSQWLRDMAAQYSTPVYIAPPRGGQVDPPCSEQNGVWGCPK